MMLFFIILLVHFVALISPGPDLFYIINVALKSFDYRSILKSVAGISTGILIWLIISITGLKQLVLNYPKFEIFLALFGALFLIYLAWQILKNSKQTLDIQEIALKKQDYFFIKGFIINLSNPKALIYFISIFSTFFNQNNSFKLQLLLVLLVLLESILFFTVIGLIFSTKKVQYFYQHHIQSIDRISALVFVAFSLFILTTTLTKII